MSALRNSVGRMALWIAALACCANAQAQETHTDGERLPGRGWLVPGTSLNLGGYASGGYVDLRDAPAMFEIDDLSFITHWESEGRWRLFAEIELKDVFAFQPGHGRVSSRSYLGLERLYADYVHTAAVNLRIGKFLTPIGRWNLVHADPLVWTTSRPLITEKTFPTNTTGLMLFGSTPLLGRSIDYSFYSATGREWRPDPDLDPFEDAFGMHASVPVSKNADFGVSLVSFEQREAHGERRQLVGFDYNWVRGRYEVSAEAAYRFSERGGGFDERGMFLQGVAPFTQRLYGVARYEYFDAAGPSTATHIWLAGLAYKLGPAFVLKAEYRQSTRFAPLAPDGLLTSVSVLF